MYITHYIELYEISSITLNLKYVDLSNTWLSYILYMCYTGGIDVNFGGPQDACVTEVTQFLNRMLCITVWYSVTE